MGAVEGVVEFGVGGEAEQGVDRGGDVFGGDGVAAGVGGLFVGGAVDQAGCDPRAGELDRVT